MRFTKMQGLGNDYIYMYLLSPLENIKDLSLKLSDRHFGIGSDGIVLILPSDKADFKMRIFNADGSEALMCGNGIRCVGKYVYDKGYTNKKTLYIETLSGIKKLKLSTTDNSVSFVTVDMGKVLAGDKKEINILGKNIEYVPVSVGNPHAVVFCRDAEHAPFENIGSEMEKHSNFKDGVNVEFAEVCSETKIRIRVWERGSGVTLACGTGACAVVSAAVKEGFCPAKKEIEAVLDGGSLFISVAGDKSVIMRGPAETVFEGDVCIGRNQQEL